VTEKGLRVPLPGEPILLKENPARYLLEDAERAVEGSRGARDRGDAETEASLARSAVFLYFAALEGFINFVYAWSEVEDPAYERWSTERKWRRAAEQCLPGHGTIYHDRDEVLYRPGDPVDPFDADSELVARFLELRDARNDMVHLQRVFSKIDPDCIDEHLATSEYYPVTGLPKKLTHYRAQHAETVAALFEAMVDRLDVCLKGNIRWLLGAPALYEWRTEEEEDGPLEN
jgi:hypothetical protein